MQPIVSVIINAYNAQKYLKEAIDSVYAQTFQDWEIIFYDDLSTDKTGEIAQSYDERLHYLRATKKLILGQARNVAIEKAQGEYIAILDSDDVWEPEKLNRQVAVLKMKPDVGFVYVNGSIISGDGAVLLMKDQKFDLHSGRVFEKFLDSCPVPPSAVMFRKTLFDQSEKIGNYRIAEDYDLYLKLARETRVEAINEKLFRYRWHESNDSHAHTETFYQENIRIKKYWYEREDDRQQKVLIRRQLALSYWGYGSWLSRQGRMAEARHVMLQSIRLSFQFKRMLKFLVHALPKPVADSIVNPTKKTKAQGAAQ